MSVHHAVAVAALGKMPAQSLCNLLKMLHGNLQGWMRSRDCVLYFARLSRITWECKLGLLGTRHYSALVQATPAPCARNIHICVALYVCWVDKFIRVYYRSSMENLGLELLPDDVLKEIYLLEEQAKRLDLRDKAQEDFMSYVHHVYDNFIEGTHHRIIAEKLERIAKGDLKRLIVNMPPRHSKSEFASYLMPSWFLGRNPKLKIIQATMNTELAVRFGRKVRDLIADPVYREVFPNTDLKQDSQAAGRWETSVGGEYFAAGVGAAMTGRGADLLIIDDPHSEQDALSASAYDNAYEWYTSGPRQRLQPGGSIIIVQTRWSKKDITGRLLTAQAKDIMADQWDVVEFPAIMPSGEPLWPEFWQKDELLKVKASSVRGQMECAVATKSYVRRNRDGQAGVVAGVGRRRYS